MDFRCSPVDRDAQAAAGYGGALAGLGLKRSACFWFSMGAKERYGMQLVATILILGAIYFVVVIHSIDKNLGRYQLVLIA